MPGSRPLTGELTQPNSGKEKPKQLEETQQNTLHTERPCSSWDLNPLPSAPPRLRLIHFSLDSSHHSLPSDVPRDHNKLTVIHSEWTQRRMRELKVWQMEAMISDDSSRRARRRQRRQQKSSIASNRSCQIRSEAVSEGVIEYFRAKSDAGIDRAKANRTSNWWLISSLSIIIKLCLKLLKMALKHTEITWPYVSLQKEYWESKLEVPNTFPHIQFNFILWQRPWASCAVGHGERFRVFKWLKRCRLHLVAFQNNLLICIGLYFGKARHLCQEPGASICCCNRLHSSGFRFFFSTRFSGKTWLQGSAPIQPQGAVANGVAAVCGSARRSFESRLSCCRCHAETGKRAEHKLLWTLTVEPQFDLPSGSSCDKLLLEAVRKIVDYCLN